ncbi:thiolase-like protein [Hyaloraphidium curvatum]|nr:thiolase-like protein [Hyaloraphidium curvatum]
MSSALRYPLSATKRVFRSRDFGTRNSSRPRERRVAVTGVGLVSSLGLSFPETWSRLLAGDSGAVFLPEKDYDGFPCRVGARVDFDVIRGDKWVGRNGDEKRTPKVVKMALAAAHEALSQAKWPPESRGDRDTTAVVIGSSVGSLQDWFDHAATLASASYRGFSPMFLPRSLANIPAGAVAAEYGFRGPISCPTTACTTGTVAIGEAFRLVRHGYADVTIAGGADATVAPLGLAGFAKLRALPKFGSPSDGDPRMLCRPFDVDRCGLLVGEGAALVVLEDMDHARARGVPVLGEILGYGSAADAFHPVRPDPEGTGAMFSMTRALEDAARTLGDRTTADVATDVGYVNAHATATLAGDEAELLAIARAFAGTRGPLRVSSCKPSLGHMMGAAGAGELILTLWALRTQTIPHTRNLKNPIATPSVPVGTRDILHVMDGPEKADADIRFAMSNSFGFGGGNATLVVGKVD